VIGAIAAACGGALQERDIFGRVGGEEFACILPETSPEAALLAAERLRQAVANVTIGLKDGGTLTVSISLGVASIGEADSGVDDLLRRADGALYDAKLAGRNCVRQSSAQR